jgi:hypothetical protein
MSSLNQLHTTLVKKSVAISISIWGPMHSRQVVVFLRSGAGGSPWRCKMFPTVWSLIR